MNTLFPQGLVERMVDRNRRRLNWTTYGRRKDGSPKDSDAWKIAESNDRRRHRREDGDGFRGRLVDLNT